MVCKQKGMMKANAATIPHLAATCASESGRRLSDEPSGQKMFIDVKVNSSTGQHTVNDWSWNINTGSGDSR
jgi:hypothetical protein